MVQASMFVTVHSETLLLFAPQCQLVKSHGTDIGHIEKICFVCPKGILMNKKVMYRNGVWAHISKIPLLAQELSKSVS